MIRTRLTERLGIEAPILCAPMAFATGGALAAAVTGAGGLGLIGGGYADPAFVEAEFRAAGNARVGCGFITWRLAGNEAALHAALAHRPAAMMLSFGDPRPYAEAVREAGAVLICQVQTLAGARLAVEAGADIVVAQGAEAGGHGAVRATMTLVPEVRDALGADALLLAAGGIADGRGLAAALALGADGVLMGSRFWASAEALSHPRHRAAAVAASGDATVRQSATDIARGYDWPDGYTARVLDNAFVARWEGDPAAHRAAADAEREAYAAAVAAGDPDNVGVFVGEAAGLINDAPPAAEIVRRTVAEAEAILRRGGTLVGGG
ncbi:nitronate monooxygenase family protein [Acuticoccus sp. I52.16.1]|uniref:NAD(P)H-dependent flavin oxidoreductase n=1 Tax=Acuticoccus sp. I52.16.1 TaxID=2928472 RepID=UPI001FD58647|nr:nitronate monooxygenase [Acuticoccus sp. I52.16.1]UOM32868.1 nitronate monooxygenase [Acuticoccus sp. I52.16.1]